MRLLVLLFVSSFLPFCHFTFHHLNHCTKFNEEVLSVVPDLPTPNPSIEKGGEMRCSRHSPNSRPLPNPPPGGREPRLGAAELFLYHSGRLFCCRSFSGFAQNLVSTKYPPNKLPPFLHRRNQTPSPLGEGRGGGAAKQKSVKMREIFTRPEVRW